MDSGRRSIGRNVQNLLDGVEESVIRANGGASGEQHFRGHRSRFPVPLLHVTGVRGDVNKGSVGSGIADPVASAEYGALRESRRVS